DFIKEDDTKTSYVRPHQANKIAEIQNAEQIIIKDIHFKGTTNYNNVNGNQKQNEAAYFGSVWGLIFKDPRHVKIERVKVSRFNYRGLTTVAGNKNKLIPLVHIIDCVGLENKGSGFWIEDTDLLIS